jgi:peptidoglycan/LPS O-acetylase OafA/YrhL
MQPNRTATQAKPFFATLDAIRGIAAILVMMRHVPFFGALSFQESYLAVDVFFLLSGVVIANAYEQRLLDDLTLRRFMLLRVIRIYPLYLLGCGLMLLALYPDGLPGWKPLLSTVALAGLLLPNVAGGTPFPLDHPAWSLFLELVANLFYAAFVRRLSNRRLWCLIAFAGLGLALALAFLPNHTMDFGWTRKTLLLGLLRVTYSFFAGILLYRAFVRNRHAGQAAQAPGWRRHPLPWLIVASVAAILMAGPAAALHPWFDWVAVIAVFPVLIYLALSQPPTGLSVGVARWLGLLSYPIYVMHVPLSVLLGPMLERQLGRDNPWLGGGFTALLLLSCWGLVIYFDAPVRRRLLALAETGYARLRSEAG